MKPGPYGPFPYSPIIRRAPLVWPDGARLALSVVPNIEFFTLELLAQAGCEYVADWGPNDDQPYMMEADGRAIVSLPYSYNINDKQAFESAHMTPADFQDAICRQFDTLYRESATSGRVMHIAVHPYLTGQPYRIGALDAALKYICRHKNVWKATGAEIAQHYRAQLQEARPARRRSTKSK